MAHADAPYIDGVFVLNEDCYGQTNSTLNFLGNDGEFTYRLVRKENGAPTSLGATAQFGAIYGDNFYICSKQAQDPGEGPNSQWQGGRFVAADATSLKAHYSIATLYEINGNSAADGRGFVGVDENKGYIGTSNGIFVINLHSGKILKRIDGTENPLVTGEEQNTDGTGPLYKNQIGLMLRTHDYVFAVHQDKGIHVIDPESDEIVTTIEGCFSNMTQSKDGRIWAARNTNENAQDAPYGAVGEEWQGNELLYIDPITLDQGSVNIANLSGNPDLIVEQSWYAWTAGSLCASTQENVLYFAFNDNIWNWFTKSHIYKYDIDNNEIHEIFDSQSQGDYYIYGAGLRVHPTTGDIYVAVYKGDISTTNQIIFQMDKDGTLIKAHTPIKNNWYPAMFIFPDIEAPQVADFAPLTLTKGETAEIPLGAMATDGDNIAAAITKQVVEVSDYSALSAQVRRDKLTVTALADQNANATVTVRFNSNGKTVDKTLAVALKSTATRLQDPNAAATLYAANGQLHIAGIAQACEVSIFDATGRLVRTQQADGDLSITLPQGAYIIRIGNNIHKIII